MKITAFRALESRNYRLYFTGQSISLIGTWMQQTAASWLIYSMTHSTFMLGLGIFAARFPSFLLSLFGGVVSDRYDRYRVLLTTQIASAVQAIILTLLVFWGKESVWQILVIGSLLGSINAFDVPARQSLVYELLEDKENLPNAIALNSSMLNLARLLGPAIAGIVLEYAGEGVCFLINAISFIAVIISLLSMRLPKYVKPIRKQKAMADLKEGFTYIFNTPDIALVLLMVACISLLVLPYASLFPVYAKDIFVGSASTFGYLNSFIGLGAVSGAISLAFLRPGADLRKLLLIGTIILGVGLILFSHQTYFPLALVFATAAGFGTMSQTTISNTILQTNADLAMRGRVISFFAMAFFGMQPIGSLLAGALSEFIGAPNTIFLEGAIALVIASLFALYLRKQRLSAKVIAADEELGSPQLESRGA